MPNLEINVIKSNLQSSPFGVKIFLAASKESGKSTWDIFFFWLPQVICSSESDLRYILSSLYD